MPTGGFARNLGGPFGSALRPGMRGTGITTPWPPGMCSVPRGAKQGAQGWHRRVTATERGGMAGGESERLSSTEEIGEPSPGDPAEGRRAPDNGPVGGKDGGNTESQ